MARNEPRGSRVHARLCAVLYVPSRIFFVGLIAECEFTGRASTTDERVRAFIVGNSARRVGIEGIYIYMYVGRGERIVNF